jgi:hypothetical protein
METETAIDCVRMMRELRERLDRETEHMTPDERIAFIRRRAEEAWHEGERRAASGATLVAPHLPREFSAPKPEKEFDAVRLMREIRERIDREVRDMTEEQRDEYIRTHAERFRNRSAERARDPRPDVGR